MEQQVDGQHGGVWDACANSAVRRAARRLGQLYDDAIEGSGLRATQFSLLAQIRLLGAPALQPLASALAMDLSALGHSLKPLLRDGLVTIEPDDRDRRVRRVSLTPAGARRLEDVERAWRAAQQRFEALVGADDAAALQRILSKVASPEFAAAFRAPAPAEDAPSE
ncbi:MarR family winged helix-turn-helix transcriptional regulator [Methylobrevis albus]|uniref:Winged helix-turn-helix transcriptional regulator n=1 Tax=Methylobrevis albus TaxID=2793297 RepID=A0A931MX95_9HYPH|nr:MarR family winged helix-turn-helix transcriptional regulator [Methylobrevis albus]MBH0236500.1 winged helix-turn-helix transcriptional regulator [Methylobrevis albus]